MRTWNPAKEDQASDRAYRIGQKKDVYVYCPTICADDFVTLDAHIDRLLTTKRKLAGDMLNGYGDIRVSDFDLGDIAPPGVAMTDLLVTMDDVARMNGPTFEAFTAALWAKRGARQVRLTAETHDRGVDVIALSEGVGVLIQCKTSASNRDLNWDAVKEVVAGQAYYRKLYPTTAFTLSCVTNAKFNSYAREQAQENAVELIEGSDLEKMLDEVAVRFTDIELVTVAGRASG